MLVTSLQKRHSAVDEWDSRRSIIPQEAQKTAEVLKGTRFWTLDILLL